MRKRLLSLVMCLTMLAALLVGCGDANPAGGSSANGKKVGVAMPTQSSERWINDGGNMKKRHIIFW